MPLCTAQHKMKWRRGNYPILFKNLESSYGLSKAPIGLLKFLDYPVDVCVLYSASTFFFKNQVDSSYPFYISDILQSASCI